MKINIAVMAGGQSRRFKADKTVELFDGKPLIKHAIDNLSDIADGIIVVAKDCSKYSFLDIECITDAYDVQCPMVGILTALKHFKTPVFVVAADVPFVSASHVKSYMVSLVTIMLQCLMSKVYNIRFMHVIILTLSKH